MNVNFIFIVVTLFSPVLAMSKGLDLHESNYMTYSYSDEIRSGFYSDLNIDEYKDLKHYEAVFQYSLKFPLISNNYFDIYGAFTQKSFWQLGNSKNSSPFRESNYRPEVFVLTPINNNFNFYVGYRHESNGRGGPLSRSWERIFSSLEIKNNILSSKLEGWYSFDVEDNPDIDKYIPPWIFTLKLPVNSSIVSVSSSYDLHYKRGYFQLEINRRITKALSLYMQYRNGYGESLIDYDLKNSRIMFGLSLLPYFELNR